MRGPWGTPVWASSQANESSLSSEFSIVLFLRIYRGYFQFVESSNRESVFKHPQWKSTHDSCQTTRPAPDALPPDRVAPWKTRATAPRRRWQAWSDRAAHRSTCESTLHAHSIRTWVDDTCCSHGLHDKETSRWEQKGRREKERTWSEENEEQEG